MKEMKKVVLEFLISCLLLLPIPLFVCQYCYQQYFGVVLQHLSIVQNYNSAQIRVDFKKKNQYVIKYKRTVLCACICLYLLPMYQVTPQ